MCDRSRFVPAFILVLFLVAGGATLYSPDTDASSVCIASAISDGRTIPNIVGAWEGTWEDTVYMVSGAMTWTISEDRFDYIGYGTIDLSAIGFGLAVQEGSASGGFTRRYPETLEFNFDGNMVGTGIGVLTDSSCAGSGVVTAPMDFGAFTYQGTVTDTGAIGRFFFNVGGAGRVVMSKTTPVESTSWGGIKADYRTNDE